MALTRAHPDKWRHLWFGAKPWMLLTKGTSVTDWFRSSWESDSPRIVQMALFNGTGLVGSFSLSLWRWKNIRRWRWNYKKEQQARKKIWSKENVGIFWQLCFPSFPVWSMKPWPTVSFALGRINGVCNYTWVYGPYTVGTSSRVWAVLQDLQQQCSCVCS